MLYETKRQVANGSPSLPAPTALLALSFAEQLPILIMLQSRKGGVRHFSSPARTRRYVQFHWGDQVASIVLFILHQAFWVAEDRERADRELIEAWSSGLPVPWTAPEWNVSRMEVS